jgi:hypothetical protein
MIYMRKTHGCMDMTKLIADFCDYANVPQNIVKKLNIMEAS